MKRKNRVPVLFSDAELAKLDELVKREGVNRSDVIRKLIERASLG